MIPQYQGRIYVRSLILLLLNNQLANYEVYI